MSENGTDTKLYRIAVSLLPGMDAGVCDRIVAAFGSCKEFMESTEVEVKAVGGLPRGLHSSQTRHEAIARAGEEMKFVEKSSVTLRWYTDRDYPRNLLKADHAPVLVYTTGDTDLNASNIIGIVGTRHATAYGSTFTDSLVAGIKEKVEFPVIVSGLAYGIDIAAHRAAIKHDIPTVGIVGHGLDKIYPAVHRDTAARMVRAGGMILSDYPHDAGINRYNFLARNRLIAALSDALVVVESGERGGALATARLAVKSGTPVFALPGRVTDTYSIGCNRLIADGIARPIERVDDIIGTLGWRATESSSAPIDPLENLTDIEKKVLHTLLTTPHCDSDTLVAAHRLSASEVMTLMIGLEMRGIVTALPGNCYEVTVSVDPERLKQ